MKVLLSQVCHQLCAFLISPSSFQSFLNPCARLRGLKGCLSGRFSCSFCTAGAIERGYVTGRHLLTLRNDRKSHLPACGYIHTRMCATCHAFRGLTSFISCLLFSPLFRPFIFGSLFFVFIFILSRVLSAPIPSAHPLPSLHSLS